MKTLEVKTILVEGWIVKVSGDSAPVEPMPPYLGESKTENDSIVYHEAMEFYKNRKKEYQEALDKFKREAIEVGNVPELMLKVCIDKSIDKIYNVEGKGLVYTVEGSNSCRYSKCDCPSYDACFDLRAIVTSKESYKCACGNPMNEGEAKTFTCCDECWDKHYGYKESATKKGKPEPDFKAMAKEWRIKTYGQQSLIDLQVEGAFISGYHAGLESKQYYENKLEASQRIIDATYLEIASLEEELRLVRERLKMYEQSF